jgi:hypothetical protein
MNSTKERSSSNSTSRKRARHAANSGSGEVVEAGEDCVRKHPESAVWTAFGGGLALGGLIVWAIFEEREHHWHRAVTKLAGDVQRRLNLR